MSKPRVLVFAPFNPYPPTNGAHHRVLQMLRGFKAMGYAVTFASSTLPTESKWTPQGRAYLMSQLVDAVEVYYSTAKDARVQRLARKFYRLTKRRPALSGWLHAPPDMRRWFARLIERSRADVVLMNYAYWDALIDHHKHQNRWRIMDTLDLVTEFEELQETLKLAFTDPTGSPAAQEKCLQLDYIEQITPSPSAREFKVYDQYNVTIGITKRDTEMIARHAARTRAHYLPMSLTPVALENQYDGSALFALGPNIFNLHGYTLFANRILPHVRERAPTFCLEVTGKFFARMTPTASQGIQLRGFVPDLSSVYEHARFFVCPTLIGTGQQIKILDAMAHGLAVVCFRRAASDSPLVHGENGFIADDAEEFAEYVARLWNDPLLSAQMGNAARATIADTAASGQFESELRNILAR